MPVFPGSAAFARVLLLAVLLVPAAAPRAQTPAAATGAPPSAAPTCAAIADDALRLACYDRAAGRAAAAAIAPDDAVATPPAAATPPTGSAAGIAPGAPGAANATRGTTDAEGAAGPLLDAAAKTARDARRALGATLGERWELDPSTKQGRFLLRPYKPMYVLPLHWTDSVNQSLSSDGVGNTVPIAFPDRAIGAKFQVSLKAKLWETAADSNVDLWAAYTQSSYWQVYSPELSRPFRETNYEPEMFAIWGTDVTLLGWRARFLGLGVNHQSNGRSDPLSRSWNRVIAQAGFERGDWSVMVRPWWRISEKAEVDDNPGIENYVGRGEVVVTRKLATQIVSVQMRHSLRGGDLSRGSVLLDWAFPVSSYLKGHLQLFSGYGESLIDFNHRQTTIGLGFSLVEWL